MMAAFPPHPGGMQPGLPHAHPGMPPAGGQPMGQPMQMGPGVSGPGNPHMAQTAAMMGMQAGAGGMPAGMGMGQSMGGPGPNSMAINHLNPQQHLIQQQQQQLQMQQAMSNPQMVQRQQLARQQQQQQQQQQQHMLQQQQINGMGMGMAHGGHPGMSQQQVAQLQNNQGFQPALPPHQLLQLQQMQQAQRQQAQHQAQQQAQQQAHAHAQAQAAQAHAQQQAQQQAHQQAQQQQSQQNQQQTSGQGQQQNMNHQIAMQHAPSQASNHSQQAPQQQAQQGPQGQMRAQSQAPSGPEGHNPSQTPQQQGQQNPQGSHQSQQGTPQQSHPTPQQMQHQQAVQRQQQALAQNMMRQQQATQAAQQSRTSGSFILKLVLFSDHLSAFHMTKRTNDIEYWQSFVSKFFAPDGRLVQHVLNSQDGKSKEFTITSSSLPRYYWTYFSSGVQNIQLQVENAREFPLQNSCHYVACERARFTFWFANGTQLIWSGKLSAMFPPGSDKFDNLEFQVSSYDEFLPRSEIAKVLSMGSPVMNRSPKMSKKAASQKMQQAQQQAQKPQISVSMDDFPAAPVNHFGISDAVMQYLEIGETFFFMRDLMEHSQKHDLRPADALNALVASFEEQQASNQQQNASFPGPQQMPPNAAQMNMQRNGAGQQFPMGSRTPMQAQMQLPPGQQPNFSPSVSNMNLPMQHLNGPMVMNGSPHIGQHPGLPGGLAPNHNLNLGQSHTPSPAQSHMAAPSMIPQHSQQGTSSSAASANTSPNVSGKRRRSQVKTEGDEMGIDMNGTQGQRVKASPRVGKKGKPGG